MAAGAALAAWSGAVLALLFRPWIVHHLFLLGLVLIGSVLAGAIGATAMLVLLLVRRYGRPLAVAMLPVVVAAAMLCFAVDWNVAFARFWFTTHRAEFVAAAELAESGALGTPGGWDYYGVELPPGLRSISVTGRMAPTAWRAAGSSTVPCSWCRRTSGSATEGAVSPTVAGSGESRHSDFTHPVRTSHNARPV
jgi:hypothetical protein